VFFQHIWFQTANHGLGEDTLIFGGTIAIAFYECRVDGFLSSSDLAFAFFANCMLAGGLAGVATSFAVAGAIRTGTAFIGQTTLDGNLVLSGSLAAQFNACGSGYARIGLLSLLDTAGITVDSAGKFDFHSGLYGAKSIWGSTTRNPTFAINASGVALVTGMSTIVADCPIVGANFTIRGATQIHPFDDAAGAYVAKVNCTIANLPAATGAGGFGQNCLDPNTGTGFIAR
jgi:hypothetical protein